MDKLKRVWVDNGSKKAAEHAAYKVALDAEICEGNSNKVNVTIMADLEKGFEKVHHSVIQMNATIYDFRPETLALALSMYTSPRRIKCGNAYSRAVNTVIGVLAGCPIAMGLLLPNVINPIESFWAKLPKQISSLWVYVDDIIMSITFDKADHTHMTS